MVCTHLRWRGQASQWKTVVALRCRRERRRGEVGGRMRATLHLGQTYWKVGSLVVNKL